MNTQEIIAKLGKYKEMHQAESDADIKARYAKKIKDLEAELADAEKAVEKKEEQAVAEEKKELSEADKKLARLKDALAAESDPDLKARYQKRINDLEGQIKEVKKEVKEEKKDIAEQKEEIKKATKEAKSAVKEVRKAAVKKVAEKVTERKEVAKKKTERKAKLTKIMSELDKLIEKNKFLKEKYKGKGVDLERDAKRKAKPFGYRFVGKNDYRVPTKEQIKRGVKRGTIDYEGRPNRSDKFPKGYKGKEHKFADGGEAGVDKFKNGDLNRNFSKISKLSNPKFNKEEFEEDGDYIYVIAVVVGSDNVESYDYDNKEDRDSDYRKLSSSAPNRSDKFPKGYKGKEHKFEDGGEAGAFRFKKGDIVYAFQSAADKNGKLEKGVDSEYVVGNEKDHNLQKWAKVEIVEQWSDEKYWETYKAKLIEGDYSAFDKKVKKGEIFVVHDNQLSESSKEPIAFAKGGKVGASHEDGMRTAKPQGLRYKDAALGKVWKNRKLNAADLRKHPTKEFAEKHPHLVYTEERLTKSDKKPSVKNMSYAKGGKVKAYKLGDMWSDDFDYDGMLAMGLKADVSWGVPKLRKLYDSLEDVNYHTANKPLWEAMKCLEKGEKAEAEEHIKEFHKAVQAELDDEEYKRGGKVKVGHSIQDKHRYAKPAGWRWKEEAVKKRVITRKQLSMSPSKKNREKHPDLVYFEDRLNKADLKPTRTSADSE